MLAETQPNRDVPVPALRSVAKATARLSPSLRFWRELGPFAVRETACEGIISKKRVYL